MFISAVFAHPSIKPEADKTKLTTDQALTYKVPIVSSGDEVMDPEIAKFDYFPVIAQIQSAQFSFENGQGEKLFVCSFVLMP